MFGRKDVAVRMPLLGGVIAMSVVSACGGITSSSDRVFFDGQFFRAKAKPVDKKKMPTEFTVVVNGVSASLDGAREAGRYEGTKFCINNFGSSSIVWKVGPDTEPQNLRISDDKLTFAGTCQRP
ncbi:hypothetical protein RUE5091_00541 [Ruegeria denitrificans]|uniref:Uncharacterized protein n=2 Tax=Ruegeria denitrificans TaxID=1715692 RepID=A0A0P1IBM6_9RHOB|nr:hypothetical protein RUE5091_00541 [Ruegeria denitrificans]